MPEKCSRIGTQSTAAVNVALAAVWASANNPIVALLAGF